MDSLLPFNTLTVALSGLGVIGTTFVRHYLKRKEVTAQQEVRNSLLFDEAFSVLRKFFMKSALHTVEETQTFGNNFVPAPFWVRVIRIVVPLSSRLEAGKVIIETLGEDEIVRVVGGREWWQRTAHKEAGIDGEWISMKRDWQGLEKEAKDRAKREKAGKSRTDDTTEDKTREMREAKKEDVKRRRKIGKDAGGRLDPGTPKEATTENDGASYESDTESAAERRAAEGQRRALSGDDDSEQRPYHEDDSYSPELDEMPLCLYLWGGAYFFGSLNTHRYVMWRIARKMGGRVFSVKYRLAPQFPFPCALQDALSAYLYLIRPPPGAKHRPVDPAKIVIAGDSAGGGLSLALLCMIRDAGLPAPAGGILLSPWCDLTHSFPSILQNTETDIPPPFGFSLFKPSTLWPPPPPEFRKRAAHSTSIDGLRAAAKAFTGSHGHSSAATEQDGPTPSSTHRHAHLGRAADRKGLELASAVEKLPEPEPQQAEQHETKGTPSGGAKEGKGEIGEVIKVKIDGEEVELADQIQLYATNDQLVSPFVSPAFAPSLGGLPPLYVMCGDKEVLRDEAIFMAHRAAHPEKYPVRKGILEANPARTAKGKDYPPTKVHLQIYDDACHDLPLFSFTDTAKYCYRAIASFALFVTSDSNEPSTPQRPLFDEPAPIDQNNGFLAPPAPAIPTTKEPARRSASLFSSSSRSAPPRSSTSPSSRSSSTSSKAARRLSNIGATIYTGVQPFNRPEYVDNMIRERISITGVVRPMEAEEEMQALTIDPEDLGLIKEGPVKRYLAGKAIWDKKFARQQRKVNKNREKHLHKSVKEEAKRITRRAEEAAKKKRPTVGTSAGSNEHLADDGPDRVTDSPEPLDPARDGLAIGGIWDLHGEHPPPSSIAARQDTGEARQLAKTLEEHYSRLHALALWSEVNDVIGHVPRENSSSGSSQPRSHHPASASVAGRLSSLNLE
ncbi:hypothetical protein JCM11491_003334 [Sporobolomyces phaffii]